MYMKFVYLYKEIFTLNCNYSFNFVLFSENVKYAIVRLKYILNNFVPPTMLKY